MKFKLWALLTLIFHTLFAAAQTGVVSGTVIDQTTNAPIPFANIALQGTTIGTAADEFGKYEISAITPGVYNIEASFVGYKSQIRYEIQVTNSRPAIVDFYLEEESKQLEEVTISAANSFYKPEESPLSLRSIGDTEIRRTPGGNRDISKVVRSLPGVASTPSFRNDIIIRGGAPSENAFYLDGIQIPVINHFQTQGSSGGPVGIINVDLLREVNFYSGAFPANRSNTMSAVFDFQLKDGRTDKWTMNAVLGASDLGITLDGPVNEKSSIVFSVRRSYLKFLFDIFNLPFLPVYNDLQFKYKYKWDDKNQLTVLGIAAVDDFSLNLDAPEKAETEEEKEEATYILNIIPVSNQWNYTVGLKFEHFHSNGVSTIIGSTNTLYNDAEKYQGNDASSEDNLIQRYKSSETEARLRLEELRYYGRTKILAGADFVHVIYNTEDFNKIVTQQGIAIRDFTSTLTFQRFGLFTQASTFFGERLTASAGFRIDANNYASSMSNPLQQFSPRLSLSYTLTPALSLNYNAGIYYQLPPYTAMGYRDSSTGELVNKENDITYIQSNHLVGGVELRMERNARITLEGFYKTYDQYPFLIEDSISLANLGADFGVIGNAPIESIGEGRSYGIEFLFQQKLYKNLYGLLSYTYVRSEFKDKNNQFVPSAWDNRHLVSLTGGKKFPRNWEVGFRWLFTGASPYTPYNVQETIRKENWDIRPFGIPDYDQLNTRRIDAFHQLDLRVDKRYYFSRWSLNVFFDVQNVYNYVIEFQDNLDVVKDAAGVPIPDPQNPEFYQANFIPSTSGTVLPTLGIIIEL